jgi:hypothetical protein
MEYGQYENHDEIGAGTQSSGREVEVEGHFIHGSLSPGQHLLARAQFHSRQRPPSRVVLMTPGSSRCIPSPSLTHLHSCPAHLVHAIIFAHHIVVQNVMSSQIPLCRARPGRGLSARDPLARITQSGNSLAHAWTSSQRHPRPRPRPRPQIRRTRPPRTNHNSHYSPPSRLPTLTTAYVHPHRSTQRRSPQHPVRCPTRWTRVRARRASACV